MKSIKPITAVLSILLLSGCAVLTTTKQRPTGATRNDAVVDSVIALNFQAKQLPDARKPELNIALEQQLGRTGQYQRRHIEKRRLKPAVRVTLWAGGAAIAGGGGVEAGEPNAAAADRAGGRCAADG